MTRRLLAIACVLALTTAAAAYAATGGGDDDPYLVRAVFDNASFVIPGEDVKVAGVEVGAIDSLDLTEDNKAVVVLRIDDPAFFPFRTDARCRVGLMSLIGEQFVDCEPTQPRADGAELPPELPAIEDGPGAGQHLLGVDHTVTPVGVDLINNVMRLPQRERLRFIINELGAGLAGNGEALADAIRRADPALQQADRVVQVLAEQDKLLGRLVDESDAVLAPLAERRENLGEFIRHAGDTAAATAERGDALEANFQKLPSFLRELKPAADRFGALASEMSPAVQTLADQAPAVNEAVARFGPFSEAATPSLETLGDLADRGRQTFPRIESLVDRLGRLGQPLAPLAKNLAALGTSFDSAGGIEELMRTIYFYTGATNGEDALGHYLRAGFGANACVDRAFIPGDGCQATFDSSGENAEAAATSGVDRTTTALLDYLLGNGEAQR
ncbi:MAG TPA: MlaD family protein [Solirubrobacteraceae bacterium]|nr:MlaD family protein [Solirubrobacteraceae bacterium]